MSDSQVLEYVKDGIRQGKEQKQLASELARRGVTKEQATRVKQLYEQQNNVNVSNATGTDINESRLRAQTIVQGSGDVDARFKSQVTGVENISSENLIATCEVLSARVVFQHIGGVLLHFFT